MLDTLAEKANNLPLLPGVYIMVKRVVEKYPNVEVDTYDGLLAEYAKRWPGAVLVKGLRAASDFEYEFQMNLINKKINPSLETMQKPHSDQIRYISGTSQDKAEILDGTSSAGEKSDSIVDSLSEYLGG